MLQQTRVAVVENYYGRFLARFPTLRRLARARRDSVLAQWSGLGYYRRARALHDAARIVMRERAGKVPRTSDALRTLPGIGRYTAAAIASIAYGEPIAVVDGNVERVLARFHGCALSTRESWAQAQAWLDPRHPGDFNQAMMELGATLCLPREPHCTGCPLAHDCATASKPRQRSGITSDVGPRPPSAGPRVQLQQTLALRDRRVLLTQRSRRDSVMPGLWELPSVETRHAASPTRSKPRLNDDNSTVLRLRHSIMQTTYDVTVVIAASNRTRAGIGDLAPVANRRKRSLQWIPLARLPKLPLTGLARKALRRAGVLE